ncbi:MAG: EamA family transporter [Coriobacteriaceae bacterium]|nr:EamA family transporter [Coriobacteriaceae bacterium]
MTPRARTLALSAALVAVAAVWGSTFVMVKDAVAAYPLFGFLAWRFAVAVVAFVVLFPRAFARFRPGTLATGLLAGAFLCAGYIFQTWGLQDTTPSKAAFITGMFVVITPLMQAAVLRRRPHWYALLGVGLAVAGLWLLTGGVDGWGAGDTRVFWCAVAYSAHMIVLGGPARRHDPAALTLVQLTLTALVCGAVSLATEDAGFPATASLWVALLVTGVIASAVAFAVQTNAQRHLSPTRTAVILTSEPAFGGLFGWLLAGDRLGAGGLVGAALILGGMLSSEALALLRPRGAEAAVLETGIEGPPVADLDG